MADLLHIALGISFMTIAIHIIFMWKGMLLYKPGQWLALRLNKYIAKPLFTCPMCMSSFWTLVYYFITGYALNSVTILIMLIVCGMNTLLSSIIYAYHEEPEDELPNKTDFNLEDLRKDNDL